MFSFSNTSGNSKKNNRTFSFLSSGSRASNETRNETRQNRFREKKAVTLENPPNIFSDRYGEIRFSGPDLDGLLKNTISGEPGVAFTIGNQHQERLAFEYVAMVRKTRKIRPVICVSMQSAFENTSDLPVVLLKKEESMIDIEAFTAKCGHPESVIAACEVANIVFRIQDHHALGSLKSPLDLLDLREDDTLLGGVDVSMELPRSTSQDEDMCEVMNVSEESGRSRFRQLYERYPDASLRCFVYQARDRTKTGDDITDDIQTLTKISKRFNNSYDDCLFDPRGLTYAKVISENSCRWHWRGTDVFENSILGHDGTAACADGRGHFMPKNYVYIVGVTGEGKSSTFNSILDLKRNKKESDEYGNVMAQVGAAGSTTVFPQEGRLVFDDSNEEFVIIDTPGFLDDKGRDRFFFDNLSDIISGRPTANLVLLVKKKDARMDLAEMRIIEQYKEIFGDNFYQMLRIVCTNTGILMDVDEDDDDGMMQPNTDTFKNMLVEKKIFNKSEVERKVFFIGKVKKTMLAQNLLESGQTPQAELDRLRQEIRCSKAIKTVNSKSLERLLKDESLVWADKNLMYSICNQAFLRISEFHFAIPIDLGESSQGVFTYQKEFGGPLVLASKIGMFISRRKTLGNFTVRIRRLTFYVEDQGMQNLLSAAFSPQLIYSSAIRRDNPHGRLIVALINDRQYIEDGKLISETVFDVLKPGQALQKNQRKRMTSSVLDISVSKLEARHAKTLCGANHELLPNNFT